MPTPPNTFLTDFPDRLSPMLVKELRQGMRARGFTMLFLIFQCLLAFILLVVGASSEETAGSVASGIIFSMFGFAVLIVQPMRGMTALSSEIAGNTIEMMALTRLTAARIVFGKWTALVSQSALILTTIIPYLILRYFYGGMVLVSELITLALIFLTSMALCAVTVGLSSFASKVLRGLFAVGLFFGLQMVIPMMIFGRMRGSSSPLSFSLSDTETLVGILCYVSLMAYGSWCALSQGISAIAPAAENHATSRRLVSIALVIIFAIINVLVEVPHEMAITIFAIILAPALLSSLTEPLAVMPPVCKPFVKRGIPGKVAGLLLLPGWPAGVFHSVALLILTGAGLFLTRNTATHWDDDHFVVIGAFLGGVLLPALLSSWWTKYENKRFGVFLLFLVGACVLALTGGILALSNDHPQFLWLLIWDPPVMLGMMDSSEIHAELLLVAALVVNSLLLVALMMTAARKIRTYLRVMGEAEAELANAKQAKES